MLFVLTVLWFAASASMDSVSIDEGHFHPGWAPIVIESAEACNTAAKNVYNYITSQPGDEVAWITCTAMTEEQYLQMLNQYEKKLVNHQEEPEGELL